MLDAARVAGYHPVLLGALNDMKTGRALYAEPGFAVIPPPYRNPISGVHYLTVDL